MKMIMVSWSAVSEFDLGGSHHMPGRAKPWRVCAHCPSSLGGVSSVQSVRFAAFEHQNEEQATPLMRTEVNFMRGHLSYMAIVYDPSHKSKESAVGHSGSTYFFIEMQICQRSELNGKVAICSIEKRSLLCIAFPVAPSTTSLQLKRPQTSFIRKLPYGMVFRD